MGGPEPSGRILFVSFRDGEREIYVMNADGSGQTNVTNDPDVDDEPDWSSDGSKIVFFSGRNGSADLYTINADGSAVRRLTDSTAGDFSPRWSPDGTRIALSRSGSLMVMDADGGNAEVIMEPEPGNSTTPCRAGAFLGSWSPDGKRLTYYTANAIQALAQVCAIDADGSNLKVLVNEPGGFHVEPVWSPDGKRIAYRDIRDNNIEVFVLDLESGERRNLSNNPGTDLEPAWSPDGNWIAFGSLRDGNPSFDIYIMRADGSDVRRLTTDPAKDSYPGWTR